MKESKIVVITDFDEMKTPSCVLVLNESQIKLLKFLYDNEIIDTERFGWAISTIDDLTDV